MIHTGLGILASGEVTPPEVVQASGTFSLIAVLIAIPLASAAVLLLAGRRANAWGHLLGTLAAAGLVRGRAWCSSSR